MSSGIEVALFYNIEKRFEVETAEMYDGKDGFREFYRDTYRKLLGYVSRMEEINESPEDMVQDIYCLAFRKWDSLKQHPKPTGWLYITANHIAQNRQRRKENRDVSLEQIMDDSDEKAGVFAAYEAVEWELVSDKLLSEQDRKIFEKYYLKNYGTTEISEELGISEENVRMRLSRIRKKMRNKLTR